MAKCKRCGATIKFVKTENDKWIPMDPDGTCHFDTCPYANEFRNKHFGQDEEHDYAKIGRAKDQKRLGDY